MPDCTSLGPCWVKVYSILPHHSRRVENRSLMEYNSWPESRPSSDEVHACAHHEEHSITSGHGRHNSAANGDCELRDTKSDVQVSVQFTKEIRWSIGGYQTNGMVCCTP